MEKSPKNQETRLSQAIAGVDKGLRAFGRGAIEAFVAVKKEANATLEHLKTPNDKEPEIIGEDFSLRALEVLGSSWSSAKKRMAAASLANELRTEKNQLVLGFKLAGISLSMGPQKSDLLIWAKKVDENSLDFTETEQQLFGALRSKRSGLLRLWLALPGGIDFLVWLREQVLERQKTAPELEPLEMELKALLSDVFAQGLLEHKAVGMESPMRVLENIKSHEQVHAISNWEQLFPRLGADRQIHAFFHTGWTYQPVAFLELALTKGLSSKVDELLNPKTVLDPKECDTVMFYSINSPHKGLKGISFGEELIAFSCASVVKNFPNIKKFATISPIPSLRVFLEEQSTKEKIEWVGVLPKALILQQQALVSRAQNDQWENPAEEWINYLLSKKWEKSEEELAKYVLTRLAAKYLRTKRHAGKPKDPVARFHLGNGASIENILFDANSSTKAWEQSWGVMVNYLYELDNLEKNRRIISEGDIPTSMKLRWQMR